MSPAIRAHFVQHGWAVVPRVVDRGTIGALRETWEAELAPFEGVLLRQLTSRPEPHRRNGDGLVCNPIIVHRLDPVRFPRAARAHVELFQRTELLAHVIGVLGGPPALSQVAWVDSHDGTALHQDPHPLDTGARMVGAWVALEDVHADAGPFVVASGSHRLDPDATDVLAWRAAAKDAARDQLVGRTDPTGAAGRAAAERLTAILARRGMRAEPVIVSAGDVILWDSALVHGSWAPKPGAGRSRQSLLLHFVEQRFAGG